MTNNVFVEKEFSAGDVVVCSSATSSAPTDIIHKAFILDSTGQAVPCLYVDHREVLAYTGEFATWRKATAADAELPIHRIKENWDSGWRFSTPDESGLKVGHHLKLEEYL